MHCKPVSKWVFAVLLCAVVLTGCATPRVVHVYDEQCQIMTRRMELTLQKVEALDACSNHECLAQAVGGALSLAASTIVSGSVALVGNVAFWLEKSANCKPAAAASSTPTPTQPAAAAASPAR